MMVEEFKLPNLYSFDEIEKSIPNPFSSGVRNYQLIGQYYDITNQQWYSPEDEPEEEKKDDPIFFMSKEMIKITGLTAKKYNEHTNKIINQYYAKKKQKQKEIEATQWKSSKPEEAKVAGDVKEQFYDFENYKNRKGRASYDGYFY
jgi:hypothetical protein